MIRMQTNVAYYCDARTCTGFELVEGDDEDLPRQKLRPDGWLFLVSRKDRYVTADLCRRCTARWQAGVLKSKDIMLSQGRLDTRRYVVVRKGMRHAR